MAANNTLVGKCSYALREKKAFDESENGYWIGLGKTSSWSDENFPPDLGEGITSIPELHALFYVDTCALVFPNQNGSLITPQSNYSIVDSNDPLVLAQSKAYNVYMSALIEPDTLPADTSYRIVGLCSNVIFSSLVDIDRSTLVTGDYVPALHVNSYQLNWVQTFKPFSRNSLINTVVQIVREF